MFIVKFTLLFLLIFPIVSKLRKISLKTYTQSKNLLAGLSAQCIGYLINVILAASFTNRNRITGSSLVVQWVKDLTWSL